ncbi:hypothetical protein BGZ60DRAFT_26101 [Tricladium varicosporioides]|nr:hypothetical protein BGZ60DRAFT_26101 [Hymenoscyphus varicosporioides]
MPFEFIDNAIINGAARKQIRSHVAKGKNVGKTHPSRRKQHRAGTKITLALCNKRAVDVEKYTASEEEEVSEVERQIGDGLSVYSFPVELNYQSKGLVKTVFNFLNGSLDAPELHHAIDFTGAAGIWVQYIFLDEAYFHCTVAMCATVVNALLSREKDSLAAMRHLSDTFRLVNEKLSGEDALSDTTMAVINGLTHFERVRGQHLQGLVHFKGLLRMAELRGGLANLKPALTQKIYRADLEFALFFGTATRFKAKDLPGGAIISCLRVALEQHQQHEFYRSGVFETLNMGLVDILIDCLSLSWRLNGRSGHGGKLDGYTYHDILVLIGYRLVSVSPFNSPGLGDPLENAIHLGCLAFLTTLLLGFGRKFSHFPILARNFRSVSHQCFLEHKEKSELYLWSLIIGGIATLGDVDDWCLMARILETSLTLDLHTWEDVARILSRFPWIHSLHNGAGQLLWAKLRSLHNTPATNVTEVTKPSSHNQVQLLPAL